MSSEGRVEMFIPAFRCSHCGFVTWSGKAVQRAKDQGTCPECGKNVIDNQTKETRHEQENTDVAG